MTSARRRAAAGTQFPQLSRQHASRHDPGMDVARMPPEPGRLACAARRLLAVGAGLADLILPPRCLACSAETGSHGALCPTCWSGLAADRAPVLRAPRPPLRLRPWAGHVSAQAIAEPPAFGRARSAARYEGTAVDLVHRLKFGDRVDIAPLMGRLMARAGADLLSAADMLVPVPLHRLRLWRRRFNQSALLCDAIAAALAAWRTTRSC